MLFLSTPILRKQHSQAAANAPPEPHSRASTMGLNWIMKCPLTYVDTPIHQTDSTQLLRNRTFSRTDKMLLIFRVRSGESWIWMILLTFGSLLFQKYFSNRQGYIHACNTCGEPSWFHWRIVAPMPSDQART